MPSASGPVTVHEYSFEWLRECIRRVSSAGRSPRSTLPSRLGYFKEYFEYFEKLGGGSRITVVKEEKYTDRDYIEDFAAYYSRCFAKYSSNTTRLHFFRDALTIKDFQDAIGSRDSKQFKERIESGYLGFVVIRPLAHAPIGRTCLKTYEQEGHRHYPTTIAYSSHLLGFDLSVDSLAFQEQDRAVSACATSALWSALQATAKLFQHHVYSPSEITKAAAEQVSTVLRAFPNVGLTAEQLARAIRVAGLEPEWFSVRDSSERLRAAVYAYLSAKIPLILCVRLLDFRDPSNPVPFGDGAHAVTITGMSVKGDTSQSLRWPPESVVILKSNRIDQLYVHDDQVGPFARLRLIDEIAEFRNSLGHAEKVPYTMTTSWLDVNGSAGTIRFVADSIMIPVYHKIRVGLDPVIAELGSIDSELRNDLSVPSPLEWDVFLTNSEDMKREWRTEDRLDVSVDEKWELLSKPFPRFVWRAKAFFQSSPYVEFVFDATDAPGSPELVIDAVPYRM